MQPHQGSDPKVGASSLAAKTMRELVPEKVFLYFFQFFVSLLLNWSTEDASTVSVSSLFQLLITLSEKNFCRISISQRCFTIFTGCPLVLLCTSNSKKSWNFGSVSPRYILKTWITSALFLRSSSVQRRNTLIRSSYDRA